MYHRNSIAVLGEYVDMKQSVVQGIQRREMDEAMHLAEGFRRMVAEQAYIVWRRLPPHTRAWLSVEDMVSDGMRWAAMEGIQKWEPKKAALSTWMFIGLRTYFDKAYESRYLTKGRYEGRTVSLDGLLVMPDEKRQMSDTMVLSNSLGNKEEPNNIFRDCYVAEVVKSIYDDSSDELQKEIKRWFLGGLERLRLTSPAFMKASKEFRGLAAERSLHYEECNHLIHSPVCLDKLSRMVMSVPFDLNHPTPGLRVQ
jgi:hypothetical protein